LIFILFCDEDLEGSSTKIVGRGFLNLRSIKGLRLETETGGSNPVSPIFDGWKFLCLFMSINAASAAK
jgi:hypothetical protein